MQCLGTRHVGPPLDKVTTAPTEIIAQTACISVVIPKHLILRTICYNPSKQYHGTVLLISFKLNGDTSPFNFKFRDSYF